MNEKTMPTDDNVYKQIAAKINDKTLKPFYSQTGQDLWVITMLNEKHNGYFVDIGAHDGITGSNSYLLEKKYKWKGICIEPNSTIYNKFLTKCRKNSLNVALTNYDGVCRFAHRGKTQTFSHITKSNNDEEYNFGFLRKIEEIKCFKISTLFKQHNVPNIIDYISLDVEGSEYEVLQGFPFKDYKVKLWTIEHNSCRDGNEMKNKIYDILIKNNYYRIVEDHCYRNQPFEDWYVHNDYRKDFIVRKKWNVFLNKFKICKLGSIKKINY